MEEYAIITSLRFIDNQASSKFLYYPKLFLYIIKLLLYIIINLYNTNEITERIIKYKKKIKLLKEYKYTIYGHESLACSLFRGFKKLNIGFTYNKITQHTKYVIVLWCDRADMKKLKALKNKFKFLLATAPTACKFDYDYQYELAKDNTVDFCLVGSFWVKRAFLSKIGDTYKNKVIPWPSGVELPNISSNKQIEKRCLVYYKKADIQQELCNILQEYNISYKNYIYGKYQIDDWKKDLQHADFVIFHTNIEETQGIALAECWASNVPTLVKYKEIEHGGTSAPYLNDKNGLFYTNLADIKYILQKYEQNPTEFIKTFTPREYVEQNMSDTVSVKKLISIISNTQ